MSSSVTARNRTSSESGTIEIAGERIGPASDGAAMGTDLANELRSRAPADFFDWG